MPSPHQQIGNQAERLAQRYLEEQSFRLVDRQWHSRYGEIDLIMWDGDELVFVEVKYRQDERYGRPEEMVNQKKIECLKRTAEMYVERHDLQNVFWRFDTVAISGHTGAQKVFHLRDVIRDD